MNEQRSIANMIAVMIREDCGPVGAEIQILKVETPKVKRKATPRKR